jgi:hypothetical protein
VQDECILPKVSGVRGRRLSFQVLPVGNQKRETQRSRNQTKEEHAPITDQVSHESRNNRPNQKPDIVPDGK